MKKIERKDFLKISGGVLAGGLTGWVFSGAPFLGFQMSVEWTQDQYVPPKGLEKFVSAVNDACPNGCDVTVRKIGERALQLKSDKGLCPSCQVSLQLLYHPERITSPLKRVGSKGSGKFEPVTWDQALKEIASRINTLSSEGKSNTIAAINKNESISAIMLDKFISASGSRNVYYEPGLKSVTTPVLNGYVDYDFNNTDYILSFGSRLIEGWGNIPAMRQSFINWKKKGVKLVHADTISTRTASAADKWLPIKAGTEAVLAFGIANYLITAKRLNSSGAEFGRWAQMIINSYPLARAASLTGISEEQIKETAEEFMKAKNPIAVSGKGGIGISTSSAEILAVYCLNSLVKTRAASIKRNSAVTYNAEFNGLDSFIKDGEINMLFLNNSNPVFKSALGDELKKKMDKAFVVSLNPIMNDSANYADYILPSMTYFETGAAAEKPVVNPNKEAMDARDIIITLSGMVDKTKNIFPFAKGKDAGSMAGRETATDGRFSFNIEKVKGSIETLEKKIAQNNEFPLTLVPMEIPMVGDGDGLAFPYVLKTIDPGFFLKGKLFVQINKETGKKYGLSNNKSIVLQSARGKLGKVYVRLTDTVAPETIAIPLGFGHESYTRYGNKKGVNPKTIMSSEVDQLTGTADWWSTRVKIS